MKDLSLMRFENQQNHRDIDTLQQEDYTQHLHKDLQVQIVRNKTFQNLGKFQLQPA